MMYELLDSVHLEDNGKAYEYLHHESQAHVVIIKNNDKNKVFSICFPTPVTSSKGIPHILEHSVLCGSKKYPLKDPFVELMKGSMNTFLNAMTFDDMTLFPIASCNDKDFKNLMDIYLDAVFYPNVLKQKEIFMQEGWHYEWDDQQLYYNGVVYNEMKGYMASPDYILEHLIKKSLYPDSCYSYHSGGKPQDIVQLDYQELLDFYYDHYHPSKCLLFIYGDIDIEERLQYLDSYLLNIELRKQDRVFDLSDDKKPMEILTGYYDNDEDYSYFAYNIIISDCHDLSTLMALQLLDYVLVSSPGALIRQALLKEGIGQDVYSVMLDNIHRPAYSIICMNAKKEKQQRFFDIIETVIHQLISEGVDEKIVKAALHSLQFKYREQEFGSYPKGLFYNQQVIMRWLYHEDHIFEILDVKKALHILEERIQNNEFQNIVEELMCNDRSKVCLYPQKQLQSHNDEQELNNLADIYDSLNDKQFHKIMDDYHQLINYQSMPETEEAMDCIPILARDDLPKKVVRSVNEKVMIDGMPLYYHELPTSGIGYLKLNFDLRYLPLELLPYASLLNSLFGMVDTKQRSYLDFYDEMTLSTGGIDHHTSIYDGTLGDGEIKLCYEIDAKMLYDEINHVERLIEEELFESCFENEQRIMEILVQEKASLQMQFMDNAHMIALNESKKNLSLIDYYLYQTDYKGYYQMICRLIEQFDINDFKEKIEKTIQMIFNSEYLAISYTGERVSLEAMVRCIKHMGQKFNKKSYKRIEPLLSNKKVKQAYIIPSQVQFVAMSGMTKNMPKEELSAFQLLQHILRCDYLWYYVRVRGGAYGCLTDGQNTDMLSIVSYRDPHIQETLDVYHNIVQYVKNFKASDREILQYIIGAISEKENPLSPQQLGNMSFSRAFSGVDETILNHMRQQMIEMNVEKIQALYVYIQEFVKNSSYCVIGNEKIIQEQNHIFDHIEDLL